MGAMSDPSDEWARLLRAANAGDARAYAQFLTAITPVLRGIVRAQARRLGDEIVEDVVQDVLLAIHLKRQTWRTEAPVRPWLYAIARYKVADAFRARGRRVDIPIETVEDALVAPAEPDPTEQTDMLRMIGMLDTRAGEIVRSIGIEGASVRETGLRLSMTEGAVRVALHRALKQLASLRKRFVE